MTERLLQLPVGSPLAHRARVTTFARSMRYTPDQKHKKNFHGVEYEYDCTVSHVVLQQVMSV